MRSIRSKQRQPTEDEPLPLFSAAQPKRTQLSTAHQPIKRCELIPPPDLKDVFRSLRNHLAGMATGVTRDDTLAREIVQILFCKLYDEVHTTPDELVAFSIGANETLAETGKRVRQLFHSWVKQEYAEVFAESDQLTLDDESLGYIVSELQPYAITAAERDAIGDAFEVFIGPALRGEEGQFFTPRNVIHMMVDILDPNPGEYILDPACGSGGFLIAALDKIWTKLEAQAKSQNWDERPLMQRKREAVFKHIFGIDKDSFLAKVTKAYMSIVGDGKSGVFCEHSLMSPSQWSESARQAITMESFDIVVTNPPFGSKIKITGKSLLQQYDLGHKWQEHNGRWTKISRLEERRPPQILFAERCLQFLKPSGRLGIVLPESLFSNPSHRYVVTCLQEKAEITGIVSLPEDLFQPYTHAKACAVFMTKKPTPMRTAQAGRRIFMSIVRWCGHDSRGNPIPKDEVSLVADHYRRIINSSHEAGDEFNRLGFAVDSDHIAENIFLPRYYDPEIPIELKKLERTHDLILLGDLVKQGVLEYRTGDEVGKLMYGTGDIPFIRTSDISNWELKIDPKHGVSEEIYHLLKNKQDVRENDILMVRDGTYLVGTCCLLTKYDIRIVYQSHLYKIRCLQPERLSPYLLLAILSSPIVRKQIRSKQFTQDIIDTLGRRLEELILPIPKDEAMRKEITETTARIVNERAELRVLADKMSNSSCVQPFQGNL